ncbi:diguanylate cyclase [Xanthobacter sp. V4C-4]|uniref:diguanylate cyclase n=1 Tax=Xanthobacter cornucopiae TaxID=3119924 RepID=UPI00372AE6C0
MTDVHYAFFGELLDTLDMALCLFDADDRCLAWNKMFLAFFPEHAGHVHRGEPYEDNLRRFYLGRLDPAEHENIDRYIRDGVERHRAQSSPFVFTHRGRRLRVSALPTPEGHRIRIWQELSVERECLRASAEQGSFAIDLLDHIPDGAMVVDQNDLIIAANDEFRRLYGIAPGETVIGTTFAEVVRRIWIAAGLPDERPEAGLLDNMRFAGSPFEIELPHGHWRRIMAHRTVEGIGYFTHSDITILKRQQADLLAAERRAREEKHRYRLLAENSSDIIAAVAADRRICFISPAVERILGVAGDALMGRSLIDLVHEDERPLFEAALSMRSAGAARHPAFVCRVRGRDESWVWMEASIGAVQGTSLHDADIAFVCSLRDARERVNAEQALKRAHEELSLIAATDALTGLANRRRFEAAFDQEWQRACVMHTGLSVAMIDIDHFKAVNDTFGHLAGDECLRRVARIIELCLGRPGDLVARYGGEEFVLLLPGTSLAGVRRLCQEIHARLRLEPWPSAAAGLEKVTVSIGACFAPPTRRISMAQMMGLADEALYYAKNAGRDRTEVRQAS